MSHFDVAILGGGLAGNLLARQLRLHVPDLSVALFEKSTERSHKVGEATVEIAANYLVRRLQLSTYLYERQLPKNGLRYFFDTEKHDAPLEDMSEVGSINLPFHPAFQIDRAGFEADLLEMNQRAGVTIQMGVEARDIELAEGGGPDALHRFRIAGPDGESEHSARWLVDASGRRGLIAKQQGLRVDEEDHRLGSVWGRFENVADIDTYGPEEFRGRIRHSPRRLSTIHFMYRGYWVWFIPLRGGLISVGVTGEGVRKDPHLRTAEGFQEFLRSHAAIAELLREAKLVDVGSLGRIAYGTRRFFHADRWGLTGEAATSADPLYSPGSDFISLENDYLTDLIARDAGGASAAELSQRADLYDGFMKFRHAATVLLYSNLYDSFGSYDLTCMKWDFDLGFYYNLWTCSYMRDQHLDEEYLQSQLRLEPLVLQGLRNFRDLFRKVEAHLLEQGSFHRNNLGRFYYGLTNIPFAEAVGSDRSEEEVMATTHHIFNQVRAQAQVLLGEAASEEDVAPLPMGSFLGRRAL